MTMQQRVAGALTGNLEMLKETLSDFSDSDMLVRPTPNANHAAWQIGHMLVSEVWMINNTKPGAIPELPAGFAEKFSKETSKSDDPAAFPKKAELLALYDKTRKALAAWVLTLSDKDMDVPAPEPLRSFAPTLADLLFLTPTHLAMHLGQIQVIRRKLGKPILM